MLVAVSIPIFTSQLEKSRESTDVANLRAAKAAAVTAYLDGSGDKFDMVTAGCFYNSSTGLLVATAADADECGKGTATLGSGAATDVLYENGENNDYTPSTLASEGKISVKVSEPTVAGGDAVIDVHFVPKS